MPTPTDDADARLLARSLEWARAELGPASERALQSPSAREALIARLCNGAALEDAVLAEVHGACARDARVADEFIAHFLPELARVGHRMRSNQLRRFLDTGDLVQSVLGDAWPALHAATFTTRPSFLAFLAQRVRWKASDKVRELNAGKRNEGARVALEGDALEGAVDEDEAFAGVLESDEYESLVRVILLLPERDRRLLLGFLKGRSIDELASEHGLTRDAARVAIQRAIARARTKA